MRNRRKTTRVIAAAALAAVLCAGLVHAQEAAAVPEPEQIEETVQAMETAQLPEVLAEPEQVPEYGPAEPAPVQETVQPEMPAPETVIAAPETTPVSDIVSVEEPVQEELPVQETEIPDMKNAASEMEANMPAEEAAPAMVFVEEPVQEEEAASVQEAGQATAPVQETVLPSDPVQSEQNEVKQEPASEKEAEPAQKEEPAQEAGETAPSQEAAPAQDQSEQTAPETSGQQPQNPEPSEEPVWLDLMPVDFRIEEAKNAQAWSAWFRWRSPISQTSPWKSWRSGLHRKMPDISLPLMRPKRRLGKGSPLMGSARMANRRIRKRR